MSPSRRKPFTTPHDTRTTHTTDVVHYSSAQMEPFMVEDNCWTSVLLHAPDDSKEYPSLAEANDFQVLSRTRAHRQHSRGWLTLLPAPLRPALPI